MNENATELGKLGITERRRQSRAIACGAIDATVTQSGREGLTQNPINSNELIRTAPAEVKEQLLEMIEQIASGEPWLKESLLETIEPFEVHYTEGDTALLTWTETNEKERVPVPSDAEAGTDKYLTRGLEAIMAPDRLPH